MIKAVQFMTAATFIIRNIYHYNDMSIYYTTDYNTLYITTLVITAFHSFVSIFSITFPIFIIHVRYTGSGNMFFFGAL